ncbi:MAG: nucleotidyltransferase family protein [Bacteroidetes bacterium]|nr:nucleotidyltransferase family protein [Bacteroidota bacterium]MCH7770503.1 nucleotidyltransferase family protein [Bacteroidota bacterium]
MKTSNEILKLIKDNYNYLSTEFGVEKIGLFGSTAKGTATKHSDVDILIEFNKPIGFKFVKLVVYLEELLGKKVDVITKDGLKNIRIKNVAENIKKSLVYV